MASPPPRCRRMARWMAVGAVAALVGCTEYEPSGPDGPARRARLGAAAVVQVPIHAQGCDVEGTTMSAWKVAHDSTNAGVATWGKTYFAKVVGGVATFSSAVEGSEPLSPGAYVISWKPVRYENVLEQRRHHRGQVFAPFEPGRGPSLGAARNCTAVLYDATRDAQDLAFTAEHVERLLAAPGALVRVRGAPLRLDSLRVGQRSGAEVKLSFFDENGEPTALDDNVYRFQTAGPRASAIPCYDPAVREPGRFGGTPLEDYFALTRGFLDGEGEPNGPSALLASTQPGLWFFEARAAGRQPYLAGVPVTGEQGITRLAMAQGQLAFTYYLTGRGRVDAVPAITIATAGWLLGSGGAASDDYQIAVSGGGEGVYTVALLPAPFTQPEPVVVTVRCEGGACVRTSPGDAQVRGVWSTDGPPAARYGTFVVTIALGPEVTAACVRASSASDPVPADADQECGAFGGRLTRKERSGGHSFSVAN